jgi:hypothetical protein
MALVASIGQQSLANGKGCFLESGKIGNNKALWKILS